MKKVIYLDAGHSNLDPGADVPNNRFENESQLNMVIRDFLVPELEGQGFEVISIPDHLNIGGSYNWVNSITLNIEDGLGLSIHNNCCDGEGAESYHHSHFESSRIIAKKLIDKFCQETGLKNRGAKSDSTTRFGALSWIRKTKIWATLIECGFMDNATDMEYVINNIPEVAKAICKGVCAIYNLVYIDYNEDENESESESIEQMNKNSKAIKGILEVLEKHDFIG